MADPPPPPPRKLPESDQSFDVPNTSDDVAPHENQPSPRPRIHSPRAGSSSGSVRRHPVYRGIRFRSGKWVSEIREPRKSTRIWLGTYPIPDMAAAAYDLAALALKGPDTALNFPNCILSYPIPASTSAGDIRAAAARAAESKLPTKPQEAGGESSKPPSEKEESSGGSSMVKSGEEFIDEEELLNMPNLLVDMAEGMLVSPPRIKSQSSDESPTNSDGESLWSYT
ncbi:ethylene-responsive transcription factor ERF027 [Ziziphus jujuba]|uniref:Ethylene-responsive transcription factor ERF027 n=1 Tax=Ziziphus jujuba TaxID=326968 RepID=A0ABM4AF39_ZIZJJ|nr:ethylene-responsive transcription factor ERF027 [Ziziphus jujuba]